MRKKKTSLKEQIISLVIVVICSIISIIAAASIHFEGPFGLIPLLIIPALIISVIRVVKYTKIEAAAANDRKEKELRNAFYEKCKSYQITSLTSAADYQKAETIAESMNLPVEAMKDLRAYFNAAKKDEQDAADAVRTAALAEEKKKEESLHARLAQFASCTGKEKRIAMLQAEYLENTQKADYYSKMATAGASLGQQKEIDWATRGGIASGLAGGAAGVATALDAQAKNEQIRAQNAAMSKLTGPAVMKMMTTAGTYRSAAKKNLEDIEAAKTKVVSKTNKETVLKNLNITDPDIQVSDTGAITIVVAVSQKEPVKILGTAPGVIDGVVAAEIYAGKELVGTADIVLPTWGVGKYSTHAEGICLTGGKKNTNYRLVYKARSLWEIEE